MSDDDDLLGLLSRTGERRWPELAPFRETVLVNFTDSALRRKIERISELLLDQALEFEEGKGFAEAPVKALLRALGNDLSHARGFAVAVGATPRVADVSPVEASLCAWSERFARDLEEKLAELDRLLGPPPDDSAPEPPGRVAN